MEIKIYTVPILSGEQINEELNKFLRSKPHLVGTKLPNELGIYDMTGNVWEWCSDRYAPNYYNNSPSSNPKGPSSGYDSVLRGGSLGSIARRCRVSIRNFISPGYSITDCGFRLAMDAK